MINNYYEEVMNSTSAHSDCNGPIADSPFFQTTWLPPSVHFTGDHRQTSQVPALPMLQNHEDRHPESLGRFFTSLVNIDEDARKMTAMSPEALRTFLTHGDSHVDRQVLNNLFDTMQGIENRLFNLRVLIFPFALSSLGTHSAQELAIAQTESTDTGDELPATPSPTPPFSAPVNEDTLCSIHYNPCTVKLELMGSPAGVNAEPYFHDCPSDGSPLPCTDHGNIPEFQLNMATTADGESELITKPINRPAPANRVKLPVSNKTSDLNRELHIPESLSRILDNIISQVTSQRARIGRQEDIISCYNQLANSAFGMKIREFLQAALLADTEAEACDALCLLQRRIAPGEKPVTTTELRDLQRYLSSQVFNGKKVSFTLQDMTHLLSLSTRPEFFDELPPSLTQLVSYLIETTLTLRSAEMVALKKRIFLNQILQSDSGRMALELLSAIATPDYEAIQWILTEIGDTNPVDKSDINRTAVNQLKEYLDEHFLASWLFAFDLSEVNTNSRKAVAQACGSKTRRKRVRVIQDDYYYDPPYVKHRR